MAAQPGADALGKKLARVEELNMRLKQESEIEMEPVSVASDR